MSAGLLKKLGGAAAILLVVWVAYLYRQVPHAQAPFAKAGDQAEQIVLAQGPQMLTLSKESGHWKVRSSTGPWYAAEESQASTLVSALKGAQIEDEISDRADRAADYDVTLASGMWVHLLGAKQVKLAEGIFGKQSPDFGHIYFRFPDKANVYLARGLMRAELGTVDINSWRSRQLIDIPEAKIQGILIEGKGFKTDLVRKSTDAWTLGGKLVDAAPVNALVGTLAHLRAEDFIVPSADPKLTFEGLTYARIRVKGTVSSADLRIGAQDPKTKRYPASIGKAEGLAWMSQIVLETLLRKPVFFKKK